MARVVALLALLVSGSAAAQADGGVSDAPLADVVKLDGGFFVSDSRMLLIDKHLAKPCPALEPAPEPVPVGPFLYGVAAGAMAVVVAVVAAVIYSAVK